ncbi:MAG: serine hydrolase [Proteobacteria bacterium]|nr:serine hydrolase [Pseudomonadota bacterium]
MDGLQAQALDRRAVLAGAGGLGLMALLLPQGPAAAEPLTALKVQTWRDKTLSEHQGLTKTAHDANYRTFSLSVSGDPADPRYVAVMFKLSPLVETHQFDNKTGPDLDGLLVSEKMAGFYPFIISATGSGANALYAAVFSQLPTVGLRGLTKAQLDQNNTLAEANKSIPLWSEAYAGVGEDTLYTATWTTNGFAEAWNCEASDEGLPSLQQRFDATYAGWGRAAHVAPTPSGGHLMMFTDSVIGPNSAWGKMDLTQYDAKTAEQTAGGLQPLRVCATGVGAATRYAAIYATRTDIAPRSFVATTSMTPMPSVDQVMQQYLTANGLRGCSLAVTVGSRLIYASGYTQCEKGYPPISPSTPMRLASVSKVFTGAAIWKLLQDRPDKITLDTKVQDILGLNALGGGAAVAGFDQITVQHLLDMASGLDQGKILRSAELASTAGAPLPVTRDQMASWAATDAPATAPGQAWAYGNLDFFLLGEIVRVLCGAPIEQAIGPLLLDNLGSGLVGARSLMQDQPSGHARHHLRIYDLAQALPLKPLDTGPSLHSPDRPTVPTQYGVYDYEVYSGAGGFSASALQTARLLASLALDNPEAGLSAATVKKWIDAVVAASQKYPGGWGYHGFDGATYVQADPTQWRAKKGGWMVSHEATATLATDGYGMVLLNNGNLDTKANFDWVTPLTAIFGLDLAKWDGVDHWQDFGMQPLMAMKSKKLGASKFKPQPQPQVRRGPSRGGFGMAPGDPKRWAELHRKTFTEQLLRRPRRPLRRR